MAMGHLFGGGCQNYQPPPNRQILDRNPLEWEQWLRDHTRWVSGDSHIPGTVVVFPFGSEFDCDWVARVEG